MNDKPTPSFMPIAPVLATVEVEVRNAREFRPEGQTKVYYSADAEVASPGQRWSTLRLKVTSTVAPVPTGRQSIQIDSFDFKKGEGVAHVVA